MRFWLGGPRFFGLRPGVSVGREDFRNSQPPRQSGPNERMTGSFVYVLRGDHNMTKIGVTTNPTARLASLRTGSAFPIDFAFIGVTPGNGYDIEQEAHRLLEQHRCNGEWFDCPPEMAIAAVMGAAAKLGHPLQSLSLEQADLTIRLATGGASLPPSSTNPRRWSWLRLLGRTALYVVLLSAVLLGLIVMTDKSVAEGIAGFGVIVPFVAFFAAWLDVRREA